MKMNTGLLLKKPGESAYSRYRRFAIANHGSYKTATQIKEALLLEKSIKNKVLNHNDVLSTPEIARQFEKARILNGNLDAMLPESKISSGFRPSKHCQKCTEIGYHSNLFELSWISECPYHRALLTEKCSTCNRELPASSDLLATLCPSCGTRISINRINTLNKSIGRNDYDIFEELEQVATVDENLFPVSYFVDRNQTILNRKQANANSSFYPSILALKDNSHSSLKKGFSEGIIHRFEVGTEQYTAISENFESSYESDFTLKFDLTKKITERVKNVLTTEPKEHLLGDCFLHKKTKEDVKLTLVDYFSSNQWESTFCTPCKVFCVWNQLIPFPVRDDLSCYINQKRIVNLIEKLRSRLGQPELELPNIVHYISLGNNKENPIKIPSLMSKKIFEIDLWCTFLYIYEMLSFIDTHYSNDRTELNFTSKEPTAFNFKTPLCFCPYYINKIKNIWVLKYPKILDKDITDSKLIRLLSL